MTYNYTIRTLKSIQELKKLVPKETYPVINIDIDRPTISAPKCRLARISEDSGLVCQQ
jgi:hypothetical protein